MKLVFYDCWLIRCLKHCEKNKYSRSWNSVDKCFIIKFGILSGLGAFLFAICFLLRSYTSLLRYFYDGICSLPCFSKTNPFMSCHEYYLTAYIHNLSCVYWWWYNDATGCELIVCWAEFPMLYFCGSVRIYWFWSLRLSRCWFILSSNILVYPFVGVFSREICMYFMYCWIFFIWMFLDYIFFWPMVATLFIHSSTNCGDGGGLSILARRFIICWWFLQSFL